MAQPTIDITQFAPLFELTEGATIEPTSGTARDFSTPQTYVVTSEDRQWKKEYTVYVDISDIKLDFSFEHWKLKKELKENNGMSSTNKYLRTKTIHLGYSKCRICIDRIYYSRRRKRLNGP